MSWIDLGDPQPHGTALRYAPLAWPAGRRVAFEAAGNPQIEGAGSVRAIQDVFLHRRSTRDFGPLDLPRLGALLALTARELAQGGDHLGFPLSQRPAPSAGAIHPIHLIVQSLELDGWHRYDPKNHELVSVPCTLPPDQVRQGLDSLVQAPAATLLLLAAEPGRTAAKYANPSSLVWRDAGVLLGYLSLAAQALDLGFLPLGVTADPWVARLVDQPGLAGVGAAFVGTRA